MENLKKLYEKKLKYNCYVTSMKYYNDYLYIIYISTSDFIICNNYHGCVAIGKRIYNYDNDTIKIDYIIYKNEFTKSTIEHLIKKYESKFNIKSKYLINGIVED